MSDTSQHIIDTVAKILCKENGDNPRLTIEIGDYVVKRKIKVWEHYIPAAEAAIKFGCRNYNEGLK